MRITNNHNIPLPLAVWLVHDQYDYVEQERYISATSIMKPIRQIVLGARVPQSERVIDVADLLASRMGTALHDSIELAWKRNGRKALKLLGYPDHIANALLVNPTPEEVAANPGAICCYMEIREYKMLDGWKIGGKYDMILEGRLYDNKSTSVWAYMMGGKDDSYAYQGGIYRWLNPEKVIEPNIHINFIFTDWQRSQVGSRPEYPPVKAAAYEVKMLDIPEVERRMRAKLRQLEKFMDAPQDEIPECTDEELWRSAPQYKYFSDPEKAKQPGARSTKNFTDLVEANKHLSACGKGVVVTIPGEVKACGYCPAFDICEQRKRYFP